MAKAAKSPAAPRRIGLLVGREWSFPPAVIDEVHRRDQGVVAEYVRVGATAANEPCPYHVIIDRVSHAVPYYRSYLKHAVLSGTIVVNNPFMASADDRFYAASLVERQGVTVPRTLALPNKSYAPWFVPEEGLRNLVFPLDWDAIAAYVGLPCVLRNAEVGREQAQVCHSPEELLHYYDRSGQSTMIVQEFIAWDAFARCLCVGPDDVLVMRYDPTTREHGSAAGFLGEKVERRVVEDARTIARALGHDVSAIDFAIRDGVPCAVDFGNPAPELDVSALTPPHFEWVVQHMADLAIALARKSRRQARSLAWNKLLAAGR